MTQLEKYHTIMANPDFYWENNQVARKLHNEEISTYTEYKKQCSIAGCTSYSEDVFNAHLEKIQYH